MPSGLGRLREQRLLRVRVERPVGLDLDEALARERVGERAVHEPHALLELRLLVRGRDSSARSRSSTTGSELLDQPLGGARDQVGLVARARLR